MTSRFTYIAKEKARDLIGSKLGRFCKIFSDLINYSYKILQKKNFCFLIWLQTVIILKFSKTKILLFESEKEKIICFGGKFCLEN